MKHIFIILLFLTPFWGSAQDEYYQKKSNRTPIKRPYVILLRDGTRLRGEIVSQDSIEAVIRTRDLGEIRIKPDQIVQMEQVGAVAASDTFPNLFTQTMRLVPTAFSAERGRVYYRNYFLYINQFELGVNDNWSIGATVGLSAVVLFGSLNTKLSFPVSQRVRLGINAQYIGLRLFPGLGGIFSDDASLGYVQGMVTIGDRQNNATYGLGSSISNGNLARTLVGSFSLVRKVNPKLSFITENFVLFGNRSTNFSAMVSGGIRFDRRRHAFDLAAYIPITSGYNGAVVITLIPFGSYHLRIGK